MNGIDLNSDMGESFGRWRLGDDESLLSVVSSANVACGFHAGDPSVMLRTLETAAARGVTVGAHVAYRDLAGFGRRYVDATPAELKADVMYQIAALEGLAHAVGTAVRYVKPHGPLRWWTRSVALTQAWVCLPSPEPWSDDWRRMRVCACSMRRLPTGPTIRTVRWSRAGCLER